ncbi:MAG: hypothetical protein IPN75_11320 [Dechloromonas sp.]|uniref:Uncharacterized protein n=1 Tax=Candidatus Dechloromonas phosphorivorans TaxID=2899244 RepID=A0A9D7LRM2_9RHOO|nr:hypothetical protein [Candidatus Dechloromonas phosphorivorans]
MEALYDLGVHYGIVALDVKRSLVAGCLPEVLLAFHVPSIASLHLSVTLKSGSGRLVHRSGMRVNAQPLSRVPVITVLDKLETWLSRQPKQKLVA